MGSLARQGLIVPELPYWTSKEHLDNHHSLSSATFAHGDLSVARYRRDRPGLGVTTQIRLGNIHGRRCLAPLADTLRVAQR